MLPAGRQAVLFCAGWCGYCTRFYPHFKALQQGFVVDVSDEEDSLWDLHELRVVPTVIVFQDGVEAKRWEGVLKAADAGEIRASLSGGTSGAG